MGERKAHKQWIWVPQLWTDPRWPPDPTFPHVCMHADSTCVSQASVCSVYAWRVDSTI